MCRKGTSTDVTFLPSIDGETPLVVWHIYDLCACSFDLERDMSTQMISFVADCTDLSIIRPLKVGSIGIEALCLSISLPTASIIIRWTLTW